MKFTCFIPIAGLAAISAVSDRIDKTTGLIRGVKIISSGAAKGHGVLIDDKTLSTVMACAQQYGTGLKVKFNPDTFDHGTGSIAGLVPKATFKIVDGALIGDLQLSANYPHRDYVLELAETQPDTFGLSIDFSGDPEEINGVKFARCTEIYAVTIVDQPAANDSGLFSAKDDESTNQSTYLMNDADKKEFTSMLAEAMRPFNERLGAIETFQKEFTAKGTTLAADDKEPECSGMSAESIAAERLSAGVKEGETGVDANRKIHAFRRTQSRPATVADIGVIVARELTKLSTGTANGGVSHGMKLPTNNKDVHPFAARITANMAAGARNQAAAIWRAKADAPKEFEEWEKAGRPMPAKA